MSERKPVNFYFILNVSPTAKTEEIKNSYLKLVKVYHPDKNRGSRLSEKKFQQINLAWEVLKDPHKRRQFDESLKQAQLLKPEALYQEPALQTKRASLKKQKVEKAIDLEIPLKVSLEDLCQSPLKKIHYLKPVNGSQVKSSLKVQIPLGAKQGTRLLFKGKGGSEGRKLFGDLYIKILIRSHKIFKIVEDSSDIVVEQPISFISAVQSEKIEVISPYGLLSLKVETPIMHGKVLKVKNYGLKNSKGERGDLFIKFFVEYPAENGIKIKQRMMKMSYQKQKVYVEKYKNSAFIYPRVLKFQKTLQELKKQYYPHEKL